MMEGFGLDAKDIHDVFMEMTKEDWTAEQITAICSVFARLSKKETEKFNKWLEARRVARKEAS